MSFKAVFRRELQTHLSVKPVLAYVMAVLVPIVLFMYLSEDAAMFSNLPLDLRIEFLTGFFLVFSFVWISGFALAILTVYKCSGFITEEVSLRTLLLMVSKPLQRPHFILAKFLAFWISAIFIQALALFVSVYVWASFFELDVFSLGRFMKVIPAILVYSVFVISVFGTLATAFSCVSSSRMKAVLPLLIVIIVAFIAFVPVRESARVTGIYESNSLSTLDIGYDLGNVYIGLIEGSGVKLIPTTQTIIGTFTGTYKAEKEGVKVDYDHAAMLPSLDRAEYRTLGESLAKLVVLPVALLALSVALFQRKDVN